MAMQTNEAAPHYGGQIGLLLLASMLALTGCMAFADQSGSAGFLPGWSKGGASADQIVLADSSKTRAPAATFIVRFKNEPALDPVYRNFRRDEAGTRSIFKAWAASHDQLDGLFLVRASYSGELILGLPKNDPLGRSARDVIAALQTIDNLAYAEIDSIATTSEEG
ncbi:MAG: hypothetical protein ACX94D_03925 [Henriciella sp.]|jgi:hypothetical protein